MTDKMPEAFKCPHCNGKILTASITRLLASVAGSRSSEAKTKAVRENAKKSWEKRNAAKHAEI